MSGHHCWQIGKLAFASAVIAALIGGCVAAPKPGAVATQSTPPAAPVVSAPVAAGDEDMRAYIAANYTKSILKALMRDGVRLHTIVYAPKDTSKKYPILLKRTPYSVGPYGETEFPDKLGPNARYARAGYIFANQDVRGRYMSEGEFENMRPHIVNKSRSSEIDESSDTYDTIDYLLKNVPNHNGRVGLTGISYPGFYSSAGMIDAHPALKAVSPQAPIADWFFDDFFHHGAFFLPHCFNFFSGFGKPRPAPTTVGAPGIQHGTPDGYQFFLDLGPLKNANERHFHGDVAFWTTITRHPNYDSFWQARDILPHLKNVAPAVLVVGGWFDAEDLYGVLNTYQAVERQNPQAWNALVMGPWRHGGWSRGTGDRLGNISFGSNTSEFFQTQIELPFFEHRLKDAPDPKLPEAYVFETGRNRWRQFEQWPPTGVHEKSLYAHDGGRLSFDAPTDDAPQADEFESDPARPTPYTETTDPGMVAEYMTEDQRFASRRADVLTYQTDALVGAITLAGPLNAELWVSTSASDADWVVKVIDVFPPGASDTAGVAAGKRLGGYQMLVRSEVIRGRFRDSYENPKPFEPNSVTRVPLKLQDVLHTFEAGHRIMIQIQSMWFPLVDRNPQKYVDNIFEATDRDFVKATHRVFRSRGRATRVRVGVLE